MDGKEDWLMRPIRAGLLPYLALKDAAYDLEDFVFCNEALDVEQENQARTNLAIANAAPPPRKGR